MKLRLPWYITLEVMQKVLGWHLSDTQTDRYEKHPEYKHLGFPKSSKFNDHKNARKVWYAPDILDYYKRRGLKLPEEIIFE